jgi:hypothetical protein
MVPAHARGALLPTENGVAERSGSHGIRSNEWAIAAPPLLARSTPAAARHRDPGCGPLGTSWHPDSSRGSANGRLDRQPSTGWAGVSSKRW